MSAPVLARQELFHDGIDIPELPLGPAPLADLLAEVLLNVGCRALELVPQTLRLLGRDDGRDHHVLTVGDQDVVVLDPDLVQPSPRVETLLDDVLDGREHASKDVLVLVRTESPRVVFQKHAIWRHQRSLVYY